MRPSNRLLLSDEELTRLTALVNQNKPKNETQPSKHQASIPLIKQKIHKYSQYSQQQDKIKRQPYQDSIPPESMNLQRQSLDEIEEDLQMFKILVDEDKKIQCLALSGLIYKICKIDETTNRDQLLQQFFQILQQYKTQTNQTYDLKAYYKHSQDLIKDNLKYPMK